MPGPVPDRVPGPVPGRVPRRRRDRPPRGREGRAMRPTGPAMRLTGNVNAPDAISP